MTWGQGEGQRRVGVDRRVARNAKSFAKANLRKARLPARCVRADARGTRTGVGADVFGCWCRRSGDRRGRVAGCALERPRARLADPGSGRRRDAGIARVPRVARRGAAGRERDTWHTAIECRSDGDIIRLIRRCRRWNPGRDGRAGRPIATRERRRDFLGRARRCPSRACRGRVHADPRVSGEETLRVRCSIPIKSLSRFGNNARVAFALARRARASFGRAQARTWRPKPWSWRRPFY